MTPDSSPYDVFLAHGYFITVLEGSSSIFTFPRHFEYVSPVLHWFYTQASPECAPLFQILNEFLDRALEGSTFFTVQMPPVAIELLRLGVGGHAMDLVRQRVEELVG